MFWNKNGNQENNDSQSSKVEELMMRQNAKLESELEAQKQANEYLAKQVEELKHASKNNDKQVELEAYLKDMQAEVARLQKENEEIINKAYTPEKEISVLKDSVAQKDNEIYSIKKQVAAKNAEVAVRMKELDAREKSVIDAESTYQATIEAMTEKMLSLGGEDCVCMGCDFDGVSSLPKGIHDVSDITVIYNIFRENFGKDIAEKILWRNAARFFRMEE